MRPKIFSRLNSSSTRACAARPSRARSSRSPTARSTPVVSAAGSPCATRIASASSLDHVGDPADGGRHDRASVRHGLEQRHRHALGNGRHHEDVALRELFASCAVVQPAGPADPGIAALERRQLVREEHRNRQASRAGRGTRRGSRAAHAAAPGRPSRGWRSRPGRAPADHCRSLRPEVRPGAHR